MYDAQADTIDIGDIASNQNNRIVLRRIKRNSKYDENNIALYIQNQHDEEGESCIDYVPEGANDMGWLGYFVGKNEHLKELHLRDFDDMSIDIIKPFLMGVSNNRSINTLDFRSMDLLDGKMFTMLGPFFENNYNPLVNLKVSNCHWGDLTDDGWRLLALAIGSSKSKSLKNMELNDNDISDEALVDIITSLSMHPQLQEIDLAGNRLNQNGCKALATLFQNSVTQLQHLDLGDNELDDESITALVPALKNCSQLHTLRLSRNESIASGGWKQLASTLEPPTSKLETLHLLGNAIDDDALVAFASSLVNNCTFTTFSVDNNESITRGGEAFSKLLCDTSSVNSTYKSNHTLRHMFNGRHDYPFQNLVRPLLNMNQIANKKEVAMVKILKYHDDFDMMPFFEWEFKILPLMINWFERASAIMPVVSFGQRVRRGKLSSIYQFVRGMPLLYVETRLKKELDDIKEELPELDQRKILIEQRKLLLEERKKSIIDRLGRRP